MGKKSTPKAPAAPDPVAVANAQAGANEQAALTQAGLNRIDQVTPQGSLSYKQIGTWEDGTPRFQQTQSYSPSEQALYDQQNQISQQLGTLATQNIGRVQDAQSTPFSYAGMTPLQGVQGAQGLIFGTQNPKVQSQVGYAGGVLSGYGSGGQIQNTFNPGSGSLTSNVGTSPFQSNIAGTGGITSGVSGGPIQQSLGGGGPLASNVQAGDIQNTFNGGGDLAHMAYGGDISRFVAGGGNIAGPVQPGSIQSGLNYGNLSAMPDGNSFDQTSRAAADAMYSQAASRLDPQFAQDEASMRTRLANAGISENSAAYTREMDNFMRRRTDAYNQANYSSIGAGLAAQQQGYGQALATRQQGVGEVNTQGQFANNAQAQQFSQGQQNAQLQNQGQLQQFNQNLQQGAFTNAAQAQQYEQSFNNAQLNNAAQALQYDQNLGAAQFGNAAQAQQFSQGQQNAQLQNAAQGQQFAQSEAQGNFANAAQGQQFGQAVQAAGVNNAAQAQQFGQNAQQLQAYNQAAQALYEQRMGNATLNNATVGQQFQQNLGQAAFSNDAQQQANQQNMQQAAFGNAAQDQQYQQNLSNAGFANQAAGQQFSQDQQNAGFNNQTQNQAFNQNLAGAQLNNQNRQQQIDEATYLRNLPLNEIAALLGTGGGVQNPTFNPFAQVGVAAPDYQGAVYQNYNAQMQQYQQAQANRAQGLGSIFGALGSLGGAAIQAGMFASDRRLKHTISRIGSTLAGIPLYVFSYAGETSRRVGVMAQDVLKVIPEAVGVGPNGYMYVDYGRVR